MQLHPTHAPQTNAAHRCGSCGTRRWLLLQLRTQLVWCTLFVSRRCCRCRFLLQLLRSRVQRSGQLLFCELLGATSAALLGATAALVGCLLIGAAWLLLLFACSANQLGLL